MSSPANLNLLHLASWDLPVYQLYGLNVASDVPISTPLVPGGGTPDLCLLQSEQPIPLPVSPPCYTSTRLSPEGRAVLTIYREEGVDTLVLADDTRFRIEGDRIDVDTSPGASTRSVEIFFLGTLLSYVLEHRGVPVLHAATVDIDGRAVAFLAGNGGGKSSLAAGFLQAGFPLVSDDLLPIARAGMDYVALPGYPQMRFWPDQALAFTGELRSLERVLPGVEKRRVPVGSGGFGRFTRDPVPLAAIYIPERYAALDPDATPEIVPVPAKQAVVELSRELFLRPVLATLGLMAPRLAFFATFGGAVPVRRLRYPSGLEHLPAAVEAVRRDLEREP